MPKPSIRRTVKPPARRRLLVAAGCGALVILVIVGAAPSSAHAQLPIGPLVDALGGGVASGLGGVAVDGFAAIFKALFSFPAELVTRDLLAWLVAVPTYAVAPSTAGGPGSASNLAELGQTTSAMAFAALGAFGTVSGVRYWAAGLAGFGGFGGLEGLARTIAAALFVIAWPWLFGHCAELANHATRGLLGSGSVLDDTSRMLSTAFALSVGMNFFAIVIACVAGVLFLALLMMKILVSASTALVFVAMPLAVVMWVLPEFAWIARVAMRAFAVVLLVPMVWTVCFATFGAVGIDALAAKGGGSFLDSLLMPLVALALLWLTVSLPRTLGRMALAGASAPSSAFLNRSASYITARRLDAAVAGALPHRAGVGSAAASAAPAGAAGGLAGAGIATAAHAAAATPATAAAAPVAQIAGAGAAQRTISAVAPEKPVAHASTSAGRTEPESLWRVPAWREISERVPAEQDAALAREPDVTSAHVAAAMTVLPPDAQRGVRELMTAKQGEIRGEMVHQAARTDITDAQREAFRTLAAAAPGVRAEGIAQHLATPAEPATAAASEGDGTAPAMASHDHASESGAPSAPHPGPATTETSAPASPAGDAEESRPEETT